MLQNSGLTGADNTLSDLTKSTFCRGQQMANPSIPLTQEYLKSVLDYDAETGVFVWRDELQRNRYNGRIAGRKRRDGYLEIKVSGRAYPSHRVAWFYIYNRWPHQHLDHINGDKADNRIVNLRECSPAQNARNVKIRVTNTSGYKGVVFYKRVKRWGASIRADGRRIYLGLFDSPSDAHAAYCAASKKYHGKFSRTE